MNNPSMDEALEWARNLLHDKLEQVGPADKVSIYASYVQFQASKQNLEVAQGTLDVSERTRRLTRGLMALTAILAFIATTAYFAQIPSIGFSYAPIVGLIVLIFVILAIRSEMRLNRSGTTVKTNP